MSAISQLLLTRFWPKFKDRFLGPSWADFNCYGDICSGNICPGDICPYQEYLSWYWHDFNQTLKVGSWDHLWFQMSPWHLYRQYLCWQLFFISWIAQLFLTQFWPNFVWVLIFLDQNSFWPKIFLDPKYLGHNISLDQNFSSQILFDPKSFWPNIFWEPICLEPKFFGLNIQFWPNFF